MKPFKHARNLRGAAVPPDFALRAHPGYMSLAAAAQIP